VVAGRRVAWKWRSEQVGYVRDELYFLGLRATTLARGGVEKPETDPLLARLEACHRENPRGRRALPALRVGWSVQRVEARVLGADSRASSSRRRDRVLRESMGALARSPRRTRELVCWTVALAFCR